MSDTDFWAPPEKHGRMAKLYRMNPDTEQLEDASYPLETAQPLFEAGGGGLVSTVDDYLKFARMLLGKGEVDGVRLLKAATVEDMRTNRLTDAQKQIPFMNLPFWLS